MAEYIKRDDAKKAILEACGCDSECKTGCRYGMCDIPAGSVWGAVDNIPAADVRENVHAQWIPNKKYLRIARCSYCNHIQTVNGVDKTEHCYIHRALYRYCPNCGADMRGDKNERNTV